MPEHILFSGGATAYRIVMGPDAAESEKWAASELRRWIRDVSGAEIPIVESSDEGRPEEIRIGWSTRLQRLAPELVPFEPTDESFVYGSIGPTLYLTGGSRRGTMYAVSSFLERELGLRFYTPRCSFAPKRSELGFDRLFHRESPGIRVRNVFYYEAFDPTWAARNRVNGAMFHRRQVGGVDGFWGVHTFERFVPEQDFFDLHPEYFSEVGGRRTAYRSQLCLSNPDVLEIVVDRLLRVIEENPEYLIYDVSQNDHRAGYCECPPCTAWAEEEGGQSGVYIRFVNAVAERIEKFHPDKFVGTLAYHFTLQPPSSAKPRSNVVVRLCSHDCCFSHPIGTCDRNRFFTDLLRGWSAVAPNLYIWDYVVDFDHYVMPYPNYSVLAQNIRVFQEHKALGVMAQGAYSSRGGDFSELKCWLRAKLLWNPDLNVDDAISDFMYGYYGHSGSALREYLELASSLITPDVHIHIRTQPTDPLFTKNFMERAEQLFDEAEASADDEEKLHRVQLTRLPLLYLQFMRDPTTGKESGLLDRIREIANREGVTHFEEFPRRRLAEFYQLLDPKTPIR